MNYSRLSLLFFTLWISIPPSLAQAEEHFNSRLLEFEHPVDVDISQFSKANTLPEGEYSVDIYINERFFERRHVTFRRGQNEEELQPCFYDLKSNLRSFGTKVKALKTLENVEARRCEYLPSPEGIFGKLDSEKLVLRIAIPQIYLDAASRDAIPPSRWEQGINALLLNYDFSTTQTLKSQYDSDDLYYLNLRSGINLGAWRLRNYSTLNAVNSQGDYHSVSTYLQRDIAALRSQVMFGDTWTASDLFDSTQVRGLRLYTDSDMLPDSMNGFAPVVRGVAKSNAVVTIRQNGYMIYQSAVPQGPFALTDLKTTSSGGDLDVTVKEEDGSETHFTQPYASLAILRREGQTDVDISIGELRNNDFFTPNVFQAQAMRGLPWGMTLYGGTQIAKDYAAVAAGVGKDLGEMGAISLDVTHARSRFFDDSEQGQSWRFLYSKTFETSNTNLRIVGYRYSTEGFYTLDEWASRQDDSELFWQTGNRRSRLEGTWTQPFAEGFGNIYLMLSRQQYWQTDNVERLIQFGYSNNWNQMLWNLSWNYSDMANRVATGQEGNDNEHVFMLSLSVPLSRFLPQSYLNYSYTHNGNSSPMHQIALNGSLAERNNVGWSLQQSFNETGENNSGNAGVTWDGTYGSVKANYGWSDESRQLNYGVRGGILWHADGITLSQEMGETVALIKAPGAEGLTLENTTGIATDWRGYTVKTQMTPYEENRIAIGSNYFSSGNVELEKNVLSLVPTRGAVAKAEFVTHIGYRVLFRVVLENNKPAPFGAMASVSLPSGIVTGIVGSDGELYLAGMPETGLFTLTLQNGVTCSAHYEILQPSNNGLIQLPATCQ